MIAAALSALVAAGFRLHPARQDLHADHGRGRHHRQRRDAAVGQPRRSARHQCQAAVRDPCKVPDVTGIVARTGSDELGLDPMGPNQTDTFLVLKPAEERQTRTRQRCCSSFARFWPDFPASRSASPSRSTCACRR